MDQWFIIDKHDLTVRDIPPPSSPPPRPLHKPPPKPQRPAFKSADNPAVIKQPK